MPNVEDLQERIIQLEEQLGLHREDSAVVLMSSESVRLTKQEATLLDLLRKSGVVRKDAVLLVLYGSRADPPDSNVDVVIVSKLRKKLRRFGINIESLYGVGWHLPRDSRNRLATLIESAR